MGINISAKLLYGRYYSEIVDDMGDDAVELLNEEIYDGEFETASPWYDSDRKYWFIGYPLEQEFDYLGMRGFVERLKQAEDRFVDRFGTTGYVLAVRDVT